MSETRPAGDGYSAPVGRRPLGLSDLVIAPRLRTVWSILTDPLPAAVAPVVERAELRAIRVAGIVRGIVSTLCLALFASERTADLPAGFVAVVWLALLGNLIAAAVPFVFARRSSRLRRLATPLALFDVVVYALLVLGGAAALGLPTVTLAAIPSFVFGFVLLALAAMRFSFLPILSVGGLMIAITLAPALLPEVPPVALRADAPPVAVFSRAGAAARAAMTTTVVIVLVMIVARSRVLLVEGLRVGAGAANLARYLPAPVAERAARDGIDALSRGAEQPAAVLFADIVGFTALSERLPPPMVGRILSDLRSLQRQAIETHGGIVDKFIGDAVMGVFGVPDPDPDPAAAGHALAAARTMQARLAQWNETRGGHGEPALRVGIGVHYGPVFAGAVGDEGRLEFAVLGDTVNVAARCEALTRSVGADLVVTEAVLEAAGEDRTRWRRVEVSRVRGRGGEVELYAPT